MATIPGIDTVITRDQWERPGEEINPATGYTPPRQDWSRIKFGMAHFTAAGNLPDGDPGETLADVLKLIADTQHWYLKIRYFFPLGYLHAVDWTGRAIELRGFDYRAAANNGDKGEWADINLNKITAPVLFLVDGSDELTPAAAKTGRNLYREYKRRTEAAGGRWTQTSPKPHSETDWTGCPGDGIRADITAGRLDTNYAELEPPPPPAPPKERIMYGVAMGTPITSPSRVQRPEANKTGPSTGELSVIKRVLAVDPSQPNTLAAVGVDVVIQASGVEGNGWIECNGVTVLALNEGQLSIGALPAAPVDDDGYLELVVHRAKCHLIVDRMNHRGAPS